MTIQNYFRDTKGTLFYPFNKNKLHTKVFTYLSTAKEERVTLSKTVELPLEEINGFVTVVHNDQWWISYVLHTDEDSKAVNYNELSLPSRTITLIQVSTQVKHHNFLYRCPHKS